MCYIRVINCVAYKRLLVAMAGMTSKKWFHRDITVKHTIGFPEYTTNHTQWQHAAATPPPPRTTKMCCIIFLHKYSLCWRGHIKLSMFDLFSAAKQRLKLNYTIRECALNQSVWFFELTTQHTYICTWMYAIAKLYALFFIIAVFFLLLLEYFWCVFRKWHTFDYFLRIISP